MKQKINKLAVGLCVILSMTSSLAWYSLFSESWMQINGLTQEYIKEHGNSGPFALSIISKLITFYVMAWFFVKLKIRTPAKGLVTALLMGIAFFFVVQYTNNAFSFRSKTLSLIDGGIVLINWMMAGVILGWWKFFEIEES